MSFSGRLLKPEIYGAILHGIGINPADLTSREAADAAFVAATAGSVIGVALASGQDAFLERASISLPYAEGVLDETGIAEGGLSMWHFDPATGAWALVPGSTVQQEASRVVAQTAQVG